MNLPKAGQKLLCISVAGKTIEELTGKVKLAQELRPGFVEYRVDYLEEELDEGLLNKVRSSFKGNEIITLRKESEGGRFEGSEKSRISLIRKMLHDLSPGLMDVELDALKRNTTLIKEFEASSTWLIASHHNLTKSPDERTLKENLKDLPRFSYAAKLVRKANSFADNLTMLSLYDSVLYQRIEPAKLIAFCVGELGIYSRVECLAHGSPISYVSLPSEPVAPGQLDFEVMKAALAQRK